VLPAAAVAVVQILGDEPSAEEIASGSVTPMYFGSAFNNFGVDLFLQVGFHNCEQRLFEPIHTISYLVYT
jgi:peptide subunit release factor RF-3